MVGLMHFSIIKNGGVAQARIWVGSNHLVILSWALKHLKMVVYDMQVLYHQTFLIQRELVISLSCACPRIMKVKTCNNQFVAMLREDWRFLSSGLWAPYFWICPYVYAETCPIQSQGLEQNFIYISFPRFWMKSSWAHLRSAYVGSGGNSRSNTVHTPFLMLTLMLFLLQSDNQSASM
jgi:hypothetical protein